MSTCAGNHRHNGNHRPSVGDHLNASPTNKGFWREILAIVKRGRQVWRLVPGRHKATLGGAALVMGLTSAASTAIPVLLGQLVDRVMRGTEQGLSRGALYRVALFYLLIVAGAYLLRETLNVVRRYLVENSCTRLEKVMTVRVVSHLMKVDLGTLTHEKIGALNGRISRSVLGFVRFIRVSFLDFFPAILTGAFALAATVSKQPWLGLVMLGVIPISVAMTVWQLLSQKGIRLRLMRSREGMDGTVVELLSGLDYVRAANTQHQEVGRVAKAAEKRRAKEVRHHFQMSLFGSGKALNEGLFHILVLAASIYFAIQGAISPGDILMFSMLFLNVMTPLAEVHRVIDEGHECSLLVGDLLEMLSEPVDRSFSPDHLEEPKLKDGAPVLAAENLRVEYTTPTGSRKRALDDVSLLVRHGETVGIAGRSGCGKSTFLRVLMRLTHPDAGKASLGDVPIEAVSREAIGKYVGYVSQTPFLFQGTIAENIAYGTEGASGVQTRRAAEMAYIHDEIMAMPGGYQAPVAERGLNLSGGQRQRIALARLFLKNPPILILDEGTSALDNISERHVQQAIGDARRDRTVILVAHRLSTLRDTDRILVFDGGRIVEEGTYHDLLYRDGVFAELVRSAGAAHLTNGNGRHAEADLQFQVA
jgi:ATP-binding cassette subfamily B protein